MAPCGLPSVQPIIHPCIFTNLCRLNLLSTCTASYVSEIGSRRSYTGLLFSFCTPTNTHYVPQCYIKSRRRCTPFRKFNFVFYVVCETPASTAALFFSTFECGPPPFFFFFLFKLGLYSEIQNLLTALLSITSLKCLRNSARNAADWIKCPLRTGWRKFRSCHSAAK